MKQSKVWGALDSVYFKSAFLALTMAVIAGFFVRALFLFRPADMEPDVQLIDMEMRKQIREFASVVKTGMYIKNFEVFNITEDRFVFGAVVWFEFNTDEVMPETIERFSIVNGKILEKTPGDIRVSGTTMLIRYDVRVEAKSQLNYYRYPFDDHRISFVITNTYVTPSELFFTVDNSSFSVSENLFTANWKILELDTAWGYKNMYLDENDESKNVARPVVAYSINFEKAAARSIVIIFIPLFIALLFGLITFLLQMNDFSNRSRFTMSAVTAILSYRFIIDRMMPTVGYFTTTDAIYALILICALMIFLFQVLVNLSARGKKGVLVAHHATIARLHNLLFVVLCMFLAAATGIILLK
jgi:hypothetical protein